MSVSQMKRVFEDTTLTPTRKLIMLVLGDNSNDSGVCFPSWNTIVKKTGLSRQAVQDNLKWLSENEYIFKKNRSRKKGGRSSNKYLIYPTQNKDILDEEDFLLFEDLYTQSQPEVPPTQSQPEVLGSDTQSQPEVLESEPSLKSFNHHYLNSSKENTKSAFKLLLKELQESVSRASKVKFTEKGFKAYKLIEDKSQIKDNYMKHQEQKEQFAQTIANFLVDYYANVKELQQPEKASTPNATQSAIDKVFDKQGQDVDFIDVEASA